jgi:DNA modification methylase
MDDSPLDLITRHRIIPKEASVLNMLDSGSLALVLTSPPYPMIPMWDETFTLQDRRIGGLLAENHGWKAFCAMHELLDRIWALMAPLVMPGGIVCINVGDALRTVDGTFMLYPNAERIVGAFAKLGFSVLPRIIWRKSTNAPNKFMGSGMLPAGAYVTLEHEHILIFRKGGKRIFTGEQKSLRRRSAYFWEERNRWFSDLWDLAGERQLLKGRAARERSGAYPFELAYRLICMYSVQGDLVADPFLGTGTTALAAAAAGRSSLATEMDSVLAESALDSFREQCTYGGIADDVNRRRVGKHLSFVEDYRARQGELKHRNAFYEFPVITAQESDLILPEIAGMEEAGEGGSGFTLHHRPWRMDGLQPSLFSL